jgi:flagellar basal body-associated protein FliL
VGIFCNLVSSKKIDKMNKKKIIIGLIIAGVVVGGAIYFYKKNKKAPKKDSDNEQTNNKETNNKEIGAEVTEKDAIEIVDLINKRDTPYTAEQSKLFIDLYLANILKKDTHEKIKALLSKKESEWNTEDKLTFLILSDKVLKTFKSQLGESNLKKAIKGANVSVSKGATSSKN